MLVAGQKYDFRFEILGITNKADLDYDLLCSGLHGLIAVVSVKLLVILVKMVSMLSQGRVLREE